MNLRDLQYILAVAELGHFGRAAHACNVSQPTLSAQILKLEDELGVRIFERIGRAVRPTAAGKEILAHARAAVNAAGDIVAAAKAGRDPLSGPLRLGILPTLAPYLLPLMLPEVAEALPLAPLKLVEDLTAHLVADLIDGKLDAAIIASQSGDSQLGEILLFDEPFWIVLPRQHRLARRKTLSAADLDPKELLLLADGHCLRDQALEFCGHPQLGEAAGADIHATSLETLFYLTAANYGITLAPDLAVRRGHAALGDLVARPLVGPHHHRRVRLVYRRTMPRLQAIEKLAATIRKVLPKELRRTRH
jgi:LysR family transcriptional regulator, hydrogen peroxide-inducible genes activator